MPCHKPYLRIQKEGVILMIKNPLKEILGKRVLPGEEYRILRPAKLKPNGAPGNAVKENLKLQKRIQNKQIF
jgi:hypothetical protein